MKKIQILIIIICKYNSINKKIIEKLLNERKPCYSLEEKLLRKFYSNEVTDRHLKYELDIFWKFNDEKCKNKANIT